MSNMALVTPEKVHVVISKMGIGSSHYFENSNTAKVDEIKQLLDPGKSDKDKLEGMKHLIAWTSKGRDASAFFPDVVKNVVCSNLEVKKLVYLYLSHYSELAPETALLAINTLKRELDNANQLVRAHALRVMSSIRVRVILPIVLLSIQKSVTDSSPYVRKTAAHSLLKVYSMDIELKDQLVEIIQHLLADNSTMVVGSAIVAFSQICPDRFDLIHPHYRKLCNLLPNVDEWGQIAIITTLLRYARTQFLDPNQGRTQKKPKQRKVSNAKDFFGDDSSDSDSGSDSEDDGIGRELDSDHQLLLRVSQPLFQSRNNAVVLAVVQLYFYLAPAEELTKATKPLVRIMKSSREAEYVVLSNIATLSAQFPQHFQPYLAEFYISSTDAGFIKKSKLEILTNIANESNINKLLKEFNTYVHSDEKEFVTAAIQAIGRCATQIPDVVETCTSGLMSLLTNRSEAVVAESVVVIKNLLQLGTSKKNKIVSQMARILDKIVEPHARASIVWVIGEYCETIPLLAPDIFRTLSKSFSNEDDMVKVQILNLGVKLFHHNREQSEAFFQYVLTQAKYDVNYDIRDKARMVRRILFEGNGLLLQNSTKLFLQQKPTPVLSNPLEDRKRFLIGSLSHIVNHTTVGYLPLSDFPAVAPDPSARSVVIQAPEPVIAPSSKPWTQPPGKSNLDNFYASSDESDSDSSSGSDSSSDSDSGSDSSDSDSSSDSESSSSEEAPPPPRKGKKIPSQPAGRKPSKTTQTKSAGLVDIGGASQPQAQQPQSNKNLDDLFSLPSPSLGPTPIPTPFTPSSAPISTGYARSDSTQILPRISLLKHFNAGGLGVEYNFVRRDSAYGEKFSTVNLFFRNHLDQQPISNIKIGKMSLDPGMQLIPFSEVAVLPPGNQISVTISVQFTSVSQPAKFEIWHAGGQYAVSLAPTVGDLLKPITITPHQFDEIEKQIGTAFKSESGFVFSNPQSQIGQVVKNVSEAANVALVSSDAPNGVFKFGGKAFLTDKFVLITISAAPSTGQGTLSVFCENSVIGNTLLSLLKKVIVKE